MKKRVLLTGVLIVAMMAMTACNGMPGTGNTQPIATQARGGDSNEATVSDDKAYELKISTFQTEQALVIKNYQKLTDVLDEKSGGRLKATVFPFGQLGSDEDMLEQATQGANVAVNTDALRMGQYVKDFFTLMMGYFADNCDECYKITQTDTFKDWTNSLSKDHGIKILSFTFYDGPRHFMTNKPINTSDDLKGMRIRTTGQEAYTKTIQAMGAIPISMSWGEVYSGAQFKALESCEAWNTSTCPSRLYEVCKYQSKTGHFQLTRGLICGQSWFESPPEDLQVLLIETFIKVGQETAANVMTEADEAEKAMAEAGMTIVEPDLAPFKAAVDPVHEKPGYIELRDKLCEEIGETN